MKLHVIGRSCGSQEAGGACAGYLLEADGRRILLDCGPGVLGRLLTRWSVEDLDAIVISHLHEDHFLDLFPLAAKLKRRCLTLDSTRQLKRIPLFVPAGSRAVLATLSKAMRFAGHEIPAKPGATPVYDELRALVTDAGDLFFAVLPCTEYALDGPFEIGSVSVVVRRAAHQIPAGIFRLSFGGTSLVYSGDTGLCSGLVELARGADLFLCEATEPPGPAPFRWYEGHLSAVEAGRVAAKAGVRQLVLTHFLDDCDPALLVAEARTTFSGEVLAATPGAILDVKATVPCTR